MSSICFRLGVPQSDLEDVYQELIIKLMKKECGVIRNHLSGYSQNSFRTLLARTIVSVARDKVTGRRKRLSIFSLEERSEAGWTPVAKDASPEELQFRERGFLHLINLIGANVGDERNLRILVLRYAHGLSVNEVAQVVGLTPNAIAQRIRYMKKKVLSASIPESVRELL